MAGGTAGESRSSDSQVLGYILKTTLIGCLLALVGVIHASILYLTLFRTIPPITTIVLGVGLILFGIVELFRQSVAGHPIAGELIAAAATLLALAFTATIGGREVASGVSDPSARLVVDVTTTGLVPLLLGSRIGFEFTNGSASVFQFLVVVVLGYVFLGYALWVHPGVDAVLPPFGSRQ